MVIEILLGLIVICELVNLINNLIVRIHSDKMAKYHADLAAKLFALQEKDLRGREIMELRNQARYDKQEMQNEEIHQKTLAAIDKGLISISKG